MPAVPPTPQNGMKQRSPPRTAESAAGVVATAWGGEFDPGLPGAEPGIRCSYRLPATDASPGNVRLSCSVRPQRGALVTFSVTSRAAIVTARDIIRIRAETG
ncbi:hypothetical protein GCM10019017_20860 [Streptomyces showdoensis]